jgi:hypothetical protein
LYFRTDIDPTHNTVIDEVGRRKTKDERDRRNGRGGEDAMLAERALPDG